ncbi:hypothetical protein [Limnoglobus roseus]|uniref:Uncharacterized protein n=1 Tax=Limnoglobus roseus TaxID=2598579 RepID=A0A5C1AIN1_9BACT|nr:hypothetical protein [Limnoglobus roseus]QEL17542.1 hypothetical protein PX52LOC_04532 [Limnoglobus roseus]
MRVVIVVGLLFAAVTHVAAAPVPKTATKVTYYPTTAGAKWVYQQEKREWEEVITKAEQRKGETLLTVSVTEGGGSYDDTYTISDEGVTKLTTSNFQLSRLLIKSPAKKGDAWAVETPVQKGILPEGGMATVGEAEDVEVPAGKYHAVPVRIVVTKTNGQVLATPGRTYTHWYAPDVGLVKFHCQDGGTDLDRVLKSFTPAVRK